MLINEKDIPDVTLVSKGASLQEQAMWRALTDCINIISSMIVDAWRKSREN